MAKNEKRELSAQVILRPASGPAPTGDTAITTENLERYLPAPEAARQAREKLSRAGFEVGPLVGNSFSITASADTFEKVFRTEVHEAGQGRLELPLQALPPDLAEDISAVTFTPPPDFGPTSY